MSNRVLGSGVPDLPSSPDLPTLSARARPIQGHRPNDGTLAGIGFTGGLFGGLLGIGGGSAIAPLLLLLSSFRPREIAGTTLAVVLVISTLGSGVYASLGSLDLGLA